MPYKIQGHYDDLGDAVRAFGREADDTGNLLDRVNHAVRGLENGGWIGEGADMFYQEMNHEVLPAVRRLVSALEDSAQAVQQIVKIFQQAEYEAGHLFRGEGGFGEIKFKHIGGIKFEDLGNLKLGDLAGFQDLHLKVTETIKFGDLAGLKLGDLLGGQKVLPGDLGNLKLGELAGFQDLHLKFGNASVKLSDLAGLKLDGIVGPTGLGGVKLNPGDLVGGYEKFGGKLNPGDISGLNFADKVTPGEISSLNFTNKVSPGDISGLNFADKVTPGEISSLNFTNKVSPGDISGLNFADKVEGGGSLGDIGGSKMQDIHFSSPRDPASQAIHSGGVNMGDGSVAPNPGGERGLNFANKLGGINGIIGEDTSKLGGGIGGVVGEDSSKLGGSTSKFGDAPAEFTGGV